MQVATFADSFTRSWCWNEGATSLHLLATAKGFLLASRRPGAGPVSLTGTRLVGKADGTAVRRRAIDGSETSNRGE